MTNTFMGDGRSSQESNRRGLTDGWNVTCVKKVCVVYKLVQVMFMLGLNTPKHTHSFLQMRAACGLNSSYAARPPASKQVVAKPLWAHSNSDR